ncbi:redox-sensitive transcriptional activator SoxR [Longivirga aurantiaca]|uniref:Redox-sensitive transcriptional activator SoxR n=1 Tax=Longivirga aurantiaca TaxID=1837743 RepID=A0ABW1SW19_9ACTN
MKTSDLLSIGEVAERSGLAPSALRYYETLGLITSTRTAGDRRRYRRSVLRRLAVIRSAQNVGLALDEIAGSLADLPADTAPTKAQWARISARWRPLLDARIRDLEAVRDNLSSCIGCGCLSMRQCALFNPADELGAQGSGPRRKVPLLDAVPPRREAAR